MTAILKETWVKKGVDCIRHFQDLLSISLFPLKKEFPQYRGIFSWSTASSARHSHIGTTNFSDHLHLSTDKIKTVHFFLSLIIKY